MPATEKDWLDIFCDDAATTREVAEPVVTYVETHDDLPSSNAEPWRKRLKPYPNAVPGYLFHHTSPRGKSFLQYRSIENPRELTKDEMAARARSNARLRNLKTEWPKYLLSAGAPTVYVHPSHAPSVRSSERLLLVEGTKQTLAATAYAPEGWLVVGLLGCWNWAKDGLPNDEISYVLSELLTDIVVAFDADMRTKKPVYQAARELQHFAKIHAPNATVRFIHLRPQES